MLKEGVRRGMPQRNPYKEALRGVMFVIQYYIYFFFYVLCTFSLASILIHEAVCVYCCFIAWQAKNACTRPRLETFTS